MINRSQTFLDKMSSKKFIFATFCMSVISVLLYVKKLPANYYETISVSVIMTYLSANVAYRYVDKKDNTNRTTYSNESDEA